MISLAGRKRTEHHSESGYENVGTVLCALVHLELGTCPIEQSKDGILHKLRETEPEPNTLGLFEAVLEGCLDHLVILSDDQIVVAETGDRPVIEDSISRKKIRLSISILVDGAVT